LELAKKLPNGTIDYIPEKVIDQHNQIGSTFWLNVMQTILNAKDFNKKIGRIGRSNEANPSEASAYDMLMYKHK